MFDLTSSKLLILAVVALIVVGPKDLPALLRTLGRYMGMIRRHANDFRAQFDEAMRESELADLKKEVEELGRDAQDTLKDTSRSVESHIGDITREVNESVGEIDRIGQAKPADAEPALSSDALPDQPGGEPVATDAVEAIGSPVTPAPLAPPAAEPRPVAEATASRGGA